MKAFLCVCSALLGGCGQEVALRGEAGRDGLPGAPGAPGMAGLRGSLGDLSVESSPAFGEPGETIQANAVCHDGVPVSGGCKWGKIPGDVLAAESTPMLGAENELSGWQCVGVSQSQSGTESVIAFVVCEEP